MRLSDPGPTEDGEWLERHVLADSDAPAEPGLQHFRAEHSRLIRVTDEVVSRLRGRLQESSARLDDGLALAKRACGTAPRSSRRSPIPLQFLPRPLWYGIAGATFALAVVSGVGYWNGRAREHTPLPSRTYTTAIGQRAVVRLADGSRVTLAPQTTLQLDPAFGEALRGMSLSGEAYFEVAPGARAPFAVRTGAITTRVLGTAFTVRRYPEDAGARVTVVSGKVGVSANTPRHPAVTLAAGGVGVVTDTSATTEVGSAAPFPMWVEGQLVFHDVPAADVLAALTRWYGYQFRLTEPALARKKMTVWISTESSREALATLKLMMGVDLAFDGTLVTLSPRRTAKDATPRPRDPQHIISPRIREVGR